MPIRIMSYDGAVYRQQISKLDEEKRRAKKENRELHPSSFYPVITMVLYFGERRWSENRFEPLISANSNPPEVKMEEWLTRRENIVKLEAYKDVALNMLKYNDPVDKVSKITNLPVEVVLQLAKENNIEIKAAESN